MDIKLIMFKANGQRREFPVTGTTLTIGRSNECELQIPLGIVSRRHCQLLVEKMGSSADATTVLKIRDMGSSNGTFLNQTRIQEALVKPGDRISVGPVIFTVSINGMPEEIKPVRTVIVEHAVEPVNTQSADGIGTVDLEAEEEVAQEQIPVDPLAALQAITRPKK